MEDDINIDINASSKQIIEDIFVKKDSIPSHLQL